MSADDFLEPQVPPDVPVSDDDRTEELTDDPDVGQLAVEEDAPGVKGEEHLGLTPSD